MDGEAVGLRAGQDADAAGRGGTRRAARGQQGQQVDRLEARGDRIEEALVLLGLDRAGRVDEHATGPHDLTGRREEARLDARHLGDTVRRQPPAQLGVAAQGAAAGAWRVEKHEVDRTGGERRRGGIGRCHDPRQQTRDETAPAEMPVERQQTRAGPTGGHQRGLAARRCTEVDDRRGIGSGGQRDQGHELRARVLGIGATVGNPVDQTTDRALGAPRPGAPRVGFRGTRPAARRASIRRPGCATDPQIGRPLIGLESRRRRLGPEVLRPRQAVPGVDERSAGDP